ncbi:imidazole glycerol phosphate synthase subunit HisH [Thalassospiraceae bacterium LMO-JJ14]|nr:imidazole glycerol phosphate synthase subunit HisH [Thalassospiraceae bacterium LMO-JJ14]
MSVVIVDYGSGNLRSAAKAFERAVSEAGLPDKVMVSSDPYAVRLADRVVLPGVGAFADCKRGLWAIDGMAEAIREHVTVKGNPFFGICVGMQLMASKGLEHGETDGFGWIAGTVDKIAPADDTLKIPHMGWNQLILPESSHPLFAGVEDGMHVYFVHSYHLLADDPDQVLATVDYGGPITAAVGRDNMVGTQFHPEKSQVAGLRIITNFLRWTP